MAHVKAAGTATNLKDSNSQRLGVKIFGGSRAIKGNIIVRQRGTKFRPGKNVMLGKDYTIFAIKDGKVKFHKRRIKKYDGKIKNATFISVV